MAFAYKTGRAGNMTLGGTVLYITKWSAKVTTTRSDSTSSATYNSVTGNLWTTSEPGSTTMDGTIEGWFDFDGNSATALAVATSGVPIAAVFKVDQTIVYASGLISLSEFEVGIETKKDSPTVGFTCSYESYGTITLLP